MVGSALTDSHISALWLPGTDGPVPRLHDYPPGRTWMNAIAERCDAWLGRGGHEPTAPRRGSTRKRTSGRTCSEGVGRVSSRLGSSEPPWALGAWDPVGPALVACAEECTPGLAFRMLLRIICCNAIGIEREQYLRFVDLGFKIGYGELLVSRAEPFVT